MIFKLPSLQAITTASLIDSLSQQIFASSSCSASGASGKSLQQLCLLPLHFEDRKKHLTIFQYPFLHAIKTGVGSLLKNQQKDPTYSSAMHDILLSLSSSVSSLPSVWSHSELTSTYVFATNQVTIFRFPNQQASYIRPFNFDLETNTAKNLNFLAKPKRKASRRMSSKSCFVGLKDSEQIRYLTICHFSTIDLTITNHKIVTQQQLL